jgi:hypothetical protein
MAWQGWGAGPAGAGSAPSKVFLGIALVAAIALAVMAARDRRGAEAGVAAAAAIYFALRLLGRIGGSRDRA